MRDNMFDDNGRYTGGGIFPKVSEVRRDSNVQPAGGFNVYTVGGMSLRDYFAATATDKDVEKYMYDINDHGVSYVIPRVTARYLYADDMLMARDADDE